VDAGKVELDGAQYLGFSVPLSISQLLWIEVLLVGGAEIYRNSSTNLEERIYPGQSSYCARILLVKRRPFHSRACEKN
jgi:hypothetical protein